jgi:hypothetical protein
MAGGNNITLPNGAILAPSLLSLECPGHANGRRYQPTLSFDGQVFVGLMARDAVRDFYVKSAEVTKEQIKANVMKIYYQLVVGKSLISFLRCQYCSL